MAEIALRWMSHHSLMRREFGDSVLIGASGLAHIEQVRLRAFFPKISITAYILELARPREGPATCVISNDLLLCLTIA